MLVFPNSKLNNDNIQGICRAKNGDLWFHTFKGNIFLIQDNKISFKIVNSSLLPTNITKLVATKNQLWIASKNGIFVINISTFLKFSITKISTSDGLYSDFVNDIVYKNDSIYAATSKGISVIAAVTPVKIFDIRPVIISTKVNNTPVANQNIYDLNKNQTNIILEVAGVDLTGHFNKFQYKLNDTKWSDIQGNIFNLLLKGGKNNIVVRASDQNNNYSKKTLALTFNVAVPLYNELWFQILISILMTSFLFFIYNKRKFQKQQMFFQQQLELEKQRAKITADLHDEIGSTLSSLQINSSVASKMIETDIKSAQNIMQKVENQAKNLSEKIGDIVWSMKPGKEEFMTLSMRIKTFCNEIVGATNINYDIKIEEQINQLVTDISMRKNLVMFCKEAINNAVKYSQAEQLQIQIVVVASTIEIKISDNGIGFDLATVQGNGLGNMKKRIDELRGTFKIISEQNKGTIIKANIPISLHYGTFVCEHLAYI